MDRVKRIWRTKALIPVFAVMLFVGAFFISGAKAEAAKTLKLSKTKIYTNVQTKYYPMITTKNASVYTTVKWSVKNTKVADIVAVNQSTGANVHYKSVSFFAYQPCYIQPKKPGTTTLTIKASGFKKKTIKIKVYENGDAIGYYLKKGKNTFGISSAEKKAAKKLKAAKNKIIKSGMTKVEKIKAVNDYICKNVVYDWDCANSKVFEEYDYSITGVFGKGKTVCQGYAVTFDAFMYLLGIPCKYVSGMGQNEKHGWNMVKLSDGKWYHMDVTWNDDDKNVHNNDGVWYDYFLLTDAEIEINHSWTKSDYPTCNGTKYLNYRAKIYKDLLIDKYVG
ncbi:MAG: hypothetical protein IJL75_01260 [Eubacterium sp.]|nr:hypothetical protein [Eubacterium sp.]